MSRGMKRLFHSLSLEQASIRETAVKFAQNEIIPNAMKLDRSGEYPKEILTKAFKLGLLNCHIPVEYNGLGLKVQDTALITNAFAYGCSGISTAAEANNLAQAPLIIGGSHHVKENFLKPMTEGPDAKFAAYAVTEPSSGSDVASIKTKAEQRAEGGDWILNGSKIWITNAGVADWFFVLAKTGIGKTSEAFTGFVVPATTPGISLGAKEKNLGQRCSDTRQVFFNDVVIPHKNVVGEVGKGFTLCMKAFDLTRPLIAAAATGVATRAMDLAKEIAVNRTSMGQKIAHHQSIAFMLADMATGIELSKLITWRAATAVDEKQSNSSTLASMAKLYCSETANKIVYDGLQIHGGMGFNSECEIEKLYRDVRIFTIYEGTSQIQRLVISKNILSGK